ncbi:serine/threonine protein phosphatase [Amycolatopsis thailandensis]|uniref:Serine/threonine protein phosphatase n=1 Tax=Amycolatopsis thailandensis TaxID=589330 RepID=A0A229SBD2_9PSEU|nr:SpoIIE family protein phosphatase [Amycolatopsis thailandensis]OXM56170.1 serine/threonine protein phosphatase [Amycolatopsis thailandensis]
MSNAVRHGTRPPPARGPGRDRLRVLLVEDDDGDAFLVEELLLDATYIEPVLVERVSSLAEALPRLPGADCVLLDLQLPDATGLTGLARIRQRAPETAVVVLTGRQDDDATGIAAVAAGAQDYLAKGEVDGRLLVRALRYAAERSRADLVEQRLLQHQLQAEENARLERGLLPSPLIEDSSLTLAVRYRPGRDGALLGGDFYDAVELPDGSVQVLIGDVSGHGPDEAALGVALRIAWRSVVLAGIPMARALHMVEKLLLAEAVTPMFATVCAITVAPDRRSLRMSLAGHPPPLLVDAESGPRPLRAKPGPPLGVIPGFAWAEHDVDLGSSWSVLLYTDGIFEGRAPSGERYTGYDDLVTTASAVLAERRLDAALDQLIRAMDERHGGPLDDDLAVALLSFDPEERT